MQTVLLSVILGCKHKMRKQESRQKHFTDRFYSRTVWRLLLVSKLVNHVSWLVVFSADCYVDVVSWSPTLVLSCLTSYHEFDEFDL